MRPTKLRCAEPPPVSATCQLSREIRVPTCALESQALPEMRAEVCSMILTFVNVGCEPSSPCRLLFVRGPVSCWPVAWLMLLVLRSDWVFAVYLTLTRYCVQAFQCTSELVPGITVSRRSRSHTLSCAAPVGRQPQKKNGSTGVGSEGGPERGVLPRGALVHYVHRRGGPHSLHDWASVAIHRSLLCVTSSSRMLALLRVCSFPLVLAIALSWIRKRQRHTDKLELRRFGQFYKW